MELTIEQALQQGIAAHKEAKLQEAERLYRAILQSQPLHPDANHNLGLIAVSVNKADVALPLFKTALEANPKIEQFRLSYIDALIKEKQFENAKQVIEQAKKRGVNGDRLNALAALLSPKTRNPKSVRGNPPRDLLNNLLGHYQNKRFSDAEKLCVEIIQDFPKHQFAWKILGAVFGDTGKKAEAYDANQKAVALCPQDAEGRSNLGNTLQQLGKLDEAEASYILAILLKPDYVLAYFNLGVMLQAQGRFADAETSHKHATIVQPEYTKARGKRLISLFKLNKKTLFFNELDRLIKSGKTDAVISSLTYRAALKYGVEKPNLFCNHPIKLVSHIDLTTQCDFEEVFVKSIAPILNENRLTNRIQPLLKKGYQTSGNLFDLQNDNLDKIQNIIRLEIERYKNHQRNSMEGIIRKWPSDYRINGWLVSMTSGGELRPHIHDGGWLSGTIYINVPSKTKFQSGNLVVSMGEEKDAVGGRLNLKKTIDVVTGSLVLFPASLTHYTIPFESESNRIVLAFDIIKN